MKKIYLATSSKARIKLFKLFGLKFKVMPSRAKEQKAAGNLSYAGLVQKNALLKAHEVAARVKSGIIIAADTISVQGKLIFGKPRDLRDAKAMLKKLAQKPQRVYTGLAVIDLDKKKTLLGYEKTKVYMDRLSDTQIKNYFSKASPMDKAGSFDIQGKGALFIRRIEGCHYNVVGLPLRKLRIMLEKLGVKVLMFLFFAISFSFCAFLSGCSSEYNIVTGQEEKYYYSTDKEVAMGQAIVKAVEKEYKLADDPLMGKRVEDIGLKIAAVCDRKEIDYHFYVLEDDQVNAVSLPGGWVYINRGLLDRVDNDDQLAGVIANEVGHIVARHSIKRLQAMQGYSILRVLVAVAPSAGAVGAAADTAFQELLLGYSREDELLADRLGARYALLAGYKPDGMIGFLRKLQEIDRRKPARELSYFRTHPYISDRIKAVKQELGQEVKFQDYINTEQPVHKPVDEHQ